MSKKIFSGDHSRDMWEEINSLDNLSTGDDIYHALYFICCRIQQLEDKYDEDKGKET